MRHTRSDGLYTRQRIGMSTSTGVAPQRRRVLTLVHRLSAEGGAERVAFDLGSSLDQAKYESSFCTIKRPKGPTSLEQLRAAGYSHTALGRKSIRDVRGLAALTRLLRRERIDILHGHLWDANLWATIAGAVARTPVIVAHDHTWSYDNDHVRIATDRFVIARLASIVVCVSAEDKRKMIEIERIPPERIRVLPNGIPPLPQPSETDLRQELRIPADAPLIGAVSVLRRQKRIDLLIDATAALAERYPNVHLVVAGSAAATSHRERLMEHASERRIGTQVHLLGHRPDVADLLAAFDVACLSSDYEGQPLALLEYMAAGKPIVCTAVGGIPELIKDGSEGLLVPRRDPQALARAIETLLQDRTLATTLGAAAQERQRREFSLDAAVARVEALYDELWDGAARPGQR